MTTITAPVVAVAAAHHMFKEGLRRAAMAGANGAPTVMLNQLSELLPNPRTRCLVVTEHELAAGIAALEGLPNARLLVLSDDIPDASLAAALREPRLVGFVADTMDGPRLWEVAFLVRRLTQPAAPPPMAGDLLAWGSASVTWKPRSTEDRDRTVEAVEVVAGRFGMSRRAASVAAEAAHELLMNAMYDAPVDANGHAHYAADRQARIELADHEVPTLRLTVDAAFLALDMCDPFGRLPRNKLFGGLLRGRRGAHTTSSVLDVSHGGAGLGLFKLQNGAAIFGVSVVPDKLTVVSWLRDRETASNQQRSLSRSLFFIQAG